jgi:hypothetical protein
VPPDAALDRNAWQLLVDAHAGRYDPSQDADPGGAAERVAMIRLALWGVQLWLVPLVVEESNRVVDPGLRRANEGLRDVFLREVSVALDEDLVSRRIVQLQTRHQPIADCRLVAEAEVARVAPCLLTFDRRLRQRLSPIAQVKLVKPSGMWSQLRIPLGTPPVNAPAPGNPLGAARWWRWE